MTQSAGIFGYFLRRFRVTFLIILGLALLGISTVTTLPREANPEIEVPFAVVVTVYPGAAARDVEELVTDPVEEAIDAIEGVQEITSTSRLGLSTVSVEFFAEENVEEALRRLREGVDGVTDLPSEAESPEVVEVNFSNEPIISLGVGGPADERLLSIYAEELATRITGITGVTDAVVVGKVTEEISVKIDPTRLAEYRLSAPQLVALIRQANVNAPFGQLESDAFRYDLRLAGRFTNVSDVAAISIALPTGETVQLADLADVSLVVPERSSIARLSKNGQHSEAAVTIQVFKKTGGNIIRIIEEIDAEIELARQDFLPADIAIEAFADRAEDIRRSLRDVSRSGLQTLLIVFGILWLFLGWREALIASLAVPLSFFMAFLIFEPTGTTLNGISLFSLILSLGLLVDTAIVIVEGIHSGLDRNNLEEHAAGVIAKFKKPLIGGTLTTVAAFFPMLLVSGIIGQFLKTIPIVISATLVSALVVSLALLPPVAVQILKRMPAASKRRRFDDYFNRFKQRYHDFIQGLLRNRRLQNRIIIGLVALLVIGLSLPFAGVLNTGLFPTVDIPFMIVNVELSPGSRLERTDEVMAKVEDSLLTVPEISGYVANIGSSTSLDLGGTTGSSSEHLGSFFVNLREDRKRTSQEVTSVLRQDFAEITEARVTVADISAGPPTAAPIELRVIGPDLSTLDQLSQEIMTELAELPGAINADRNLRVSAGEFTWKFKNDELARYGLTTSDVAGLLRLTVFGAEATTFLSEAGDEISVRVEALAETTDTLNELANLPIVTSQGTITLDQIADVELQPSLSTIRRTDGDRAISVTADVEQGANANRLSVQFQEQLQAKELPSGYRLAFGGEQQETADTFNELYRSMFIAVILILLILVVEFNSYRQPLIIFLSIPLALIGVLFGLLILGGQLNFAAFIGLVSLTGIVVNNAIILVDRMNNLQAAGEDLGTAVTEAVTSRLRPIILTTITTAAGVMPLIWVDEFFRDLALTLITGLLFSSVLTLVFIPVLYYRQGVKIARRKAKQLALATDK